MQMPSIGRVVAVPCNVVEVTCAPISDADYKRASGLCKASAVCAEYEPRVFRLHVFTEIPWVWTS